ncbi:hypothetical protein AB0M28_39620 [Streptomyces sp. NPDC051940]|uniref:hypothetical protein n=1 Tax=Streptomyces sp. NPDC051940 TaxID=3155675 RepID=UPI00342B35AF
MIQSLGRRVTRAVETLLPKTTADAGCPPDSYVQCKYISGVCFCRTCTVNGACVTYCGVWYSYSNNYC